MFSCEFCGISKSTFFTEHLPVIASEDPPMSRPPSVSKNTDFKTAHTSIFTDKKSNCKVSYATSQKEYKVRSMCNAPQCNVYLHSQQGFDCFKELHTKKTINLSLLIPFS